MANPIQQGAIAEDNIRHALCSMRNSRLFWFKITDTRTLRFGNPLAKQFAQKVPGDFSVVYCGCPIIIEVKSTKLKRFKLANIKPHQLLAAEQFEQAGGTYLFAIKYCVRFKPVWFVYTFQQIAAVMEKTKSIDLARLANERKSKYPLARLLLSRFRAARNAPAG